MGLCRRDRRCGHSSTGPHQRRAPCRWGSGAACCWSWLSRSRTDRWLAGQALPAGAAPTPPQQGRLASQGVSPVGWRRSSCKGIALREPAVAARRCLWTARRVGWWFQCLSHERDTLQVCQVPCSGSERAEGGQALVAPVDIVQSRVSESSSAHKPGIAFDWPWSERFYEVCRNPGPASSFQHRSATAPAAPLKLEYRTRCTSSGVGLPLAFSGVWLEFGAS